MTEFSQSLPLGEQTLDELLGRQLHPVAFTTPKGSQVLRVGGRTTRASQTAAAVRAQQANEPIESEVIEESPTATVGGGGGAAAGNKKCPATGNLTGRKRLKPRATQGQRQTRQTSGRKDEPPGTANNYTDLFKSDLEIDTQTINGNTGGNRLLKRQPQAESISPIPGDDDEGPSPEKQLRKEQELAQLFQSDTFSICDFQEQKVVRTDTRSHERHDSSLRTSLFDESEFSIERRKSEHRSALDGSPGEASQFEVFSETLFDRALLSSEQLLDGEDDDDDDHLLLSSGLEEPLRVESELDGTIATDVQLNVENVTFSQPLGTFGFAGQNTSDGVAQPQAWQEPVDFFSRDAIRNSLLELERSGRSDGSGFDSALFSESLSDSPRTRKEVPVRDTSRVASLQPQQPSPNMTFDQTKDLRLLSNWGLPESVQRQYAKKGIVELFPWQVECLSRKEVLLEGRNLVYSAPTSAGKTLVSEFLLAKTIAERQRKCLLILPFVAVAREKTHYLQQLLGPGGWRVEGFYGGSHPPGGFESVDLAVCTIEKANSIINRLLEQSNLTTLGLVVVDEVHLIADPSRGYILELLLTKVRFVAQQANATIQIVCMSATLPNVELLARWLDADHYHTDYRPIELIEMMKIGNTVYGAAGAADQVAAIRRLDGTLLGCPITKDPEHVTQLTLETLLEGCSVIVFCPSKDWCEQLSLTLASTLHTLKKEDPASTHQALRERLNEQLDGTKQEEVLLQLRNCPAGLDAVLGKTIRYGIAFHHAGLTTDERDIVEGSFRDGALRVIVATSTLSSGVNLPARRVIVRTPKFGGRPINALTYRQMIGRAGRKGRDTLGESVLICTPAEEKIGRELLGANELPPLRSCLDADNYTHLKRAVLEIIASGTATTAPLLEDFVNATLYSCDRSYRFSVGEQLLATVTTTKTTTTTTTGKETKNESTHKATRDDPVVSCLAFLLEYEFIRLQETEERTVLAATRLGHACLAASLPPKDGFLLFSELQRARQCFVLESELHAVYLVTPYSVAYQWQQIGWMDFLDLWERLPASARRVGELVGVRESFMVRAMRGTGVLDQRALQIHKRFYTALALLDLVNEVPLCTVAKRFRCCRGLLQSLQQTAATFAGIVASFCASLNWTLLHLIVVQFRERLFFGVAHELLDLMRIASLNGQRARLLYDAGFQGLLQLANADRHAIETVLHNCASFETERLREGEHEQEAAKRKQLRNLFLTGHAGMTVREAAHLLIHEARQYLALETGLENPNWHVEAPEALEEEKKENEQTEERTVSSDTLPPTVPNTPSSTTHHQSSSSSVVLSRLDSIGQSSDQFKNSLLMGHQMELHANSSGLKDETTVPYSSLQIVDVCEDRTTYSNFIDRLADWNCISLSLAVAPNLRPLKPGTKIGGHLMRNDRVVTMDKPAERQLYSVDNDRYLAGLAIYKTADAEDPTEPIVYYLDLQSASDIRDDEKRTLVRELLRREHLTVTMLDAKEQLRLMFGTGLLRATGTGVNSWDDLLCSVQDPRVACWLLQTADERTLSLEAMIERHCPELTGTPKRLAGLEWGITPKGIGYGLHHHSPIAARQRAATESVIVSHLMRPVRKLLQQVAGLEACFQSREMPVHVVLARSEVVGFPVDRTALGALIERLKASRERIATDARLLNGGRKLDFGSSRAVAAALRLAASRERPRTVRQVLERLDNPLAALVIAYRKIDSNLARTIEPLYRTIQLSAESRVHGRSHCFTSTGRITMHEPNLQTVVKDFTVPAPLAGGMRERRTTDEEEHFSCRSTFACNDTTRVLLSADFCQLELCILTHLSQDRRLLAALDGSAVADGAGSRRKPQDVFRSLAARWHQLGDASEVSDELRTRTKAIVYGVIYGMGARAMAAELQMEEESARSLMEQFHRTYPDIRRYQERVIRLTRQLGYIETLTGRRRYLPAIGQAATADPAARAEAERQAVCTTIQGSAADILKNAIVRMERNLRKYADVLDVGAIQLVLHLHDELVYELPRAQLPKVAKILRSSMENCAKLSVPLRVKLKAGDSWGTMRELNS
ncbi:DNA polymerase theta [Anopheles darlingi]|uniref:DNA polymerase theta n=1 Tax=Anopheles darlingi TaxID=43151 RepID=W5JHI9_ANODA|nr:DNA polymerase theta [Anopheles darlingi]